MGAGFLGIGGKAAAKVDVRYMEENDVQSAVSRSRNSADRDLQQLAQAIEGELPVAILDMKQLERLAKDSVDTSSIKVGTFINGTKTLVDTFSFQQMKVEVIQQPGQKAVFEPAPAAKVQDTPVATSLRVALWVHGNLTSTELEWLKTFGRVAANVGGEVTYVAGTNQLALQDAQQLFPRAKISTNPRTILDVAQLDICVFCGRLGLTAVRPPTATAERLANELVSTCIARKDFFLMHDVKSLDAQAWSRAFQAQVVKESMDKTRRIAGSGSTEKEFQSFFERVKQPR